MKYEIESFFYRLLSDDQIVASDTFLWSEERGEKNKTTTQKRTGGHKTCGWRSVSVCTILFPLVLYRITHNLHWSTCSQSPLMYSWFLLFIFHPLSANITSIGLLGQGQARALSNVLVINMLTACFIGFSLTIPVAFSFFFSNQKRNRFSLCLAAPHFLLCPWLLQLASPPLSFSCAAGALLLYVFPQPYNSVL